MATEIQFSSDNNSGIQKVRGSDGRLNVSSRSDPRAYYNSRDVGQTYSGVFQMVDASAGEFVAYLQNASTTGKTLVITNITMGSAENSVVTLSLVTGVAASGSFSSAVNMNATSPNAATGIAMEGDSAATGITGLTEAGMLDRIFIPANNSKTFNLADRLRLGQGDAIALKYETGTTGNIGGSIFVYFE